MFDFLNESVSTLDDKLQLLIAGPSGAGKSHLIGTYPGKVLYLTAGAEIHGVSAARKSGKHVTAVAIDRDATGALSADQALARFDAATDPDAVRAAGFQLIALDGLTELEKIVRGSTQWKRMCETKGGGHNNFAEGTATQTIMDRCLQRLRNLQFDLGIDIAVTCILDVTETNRKTGEIEAAKPRLMGYSVAEAAIQQFGDIVVIGQMQKPDGTSGRALQMHTELARQSVDENKEVKKLFGITPRLQGVTQVPPYIKADLNALLELKGRK
jgi:hypothetical protein